MTRILIAKSIGACRETLGQHKRLILAVLSAGILCSAVADDQQFEYMEEVGAALELMVTDRDAAIEKLHELAERGSVSGMRMYHHNAVHFLDGLPFLKQAADRGYAPAQYDLANYFRIGKEPYIQQDGDKAIQLLTEAADPDAGLSLGKSMARDKALFRLSYMYEFGELVQINLARSRDFMQKALELQSLDASTLFGFARDGFQDHYRYTRLAAEMGDPSAQASLGQYHIFGAREFNAPDRIAYKIPKDKRSALRWLEQAASAGNVEAYESLGFLYRYGMLDDDGEYLLERDGVRAFKYYRWAAQGGSVKASELIQGINQMQIVRDWLETGDSTLTNKYNSSLEYTYYRTSIGRNRQGEKRVFFGISRSNSNICSADQRPNIDTTVWSFDGQSIRMYVYCDDTIERRAQLVGVPQTDQGLDYVVNLFKRAAHPVKIKGSGYEFIASAKGFTKAWESSTDEAL